MGFGYVLLAVLFGTMIIAALDSVWFYLWIVKYPQRVFYTSVPSTRLGPIQSGAKAIVFHAAVASIAVAYLANIGECAETADASTADRAGKGAMVGFYAFFAFNISIASMYPWTPYDWGPDIIWGTSLLSLIAVIQDKTVQLGC